MRYSLTLGLAGLLCTGSVHAQSAAQAQLAADPFAVVWAGADLIALDNDQHVWRRAAADGSPWQPVILPADELAGAVSSLNCAADDSGDCILTMKAGNKTWLDRFDATTGLVTHLPVTGATILDMPYRDTVYLSRKRADGGQDLSLLSAGKETPIGATTGDENAIFLPIDGRMTPVAYRLKGGMHVISAIDPAPVFYDGIENMLISGDGLVERETWTQDPPQVAGRRSLSFVRLARDGSRISAKGKIIIALPTSGPLVEARNGAVDANNDMVVELVSRDVDTLAVLCKNGDNYAFQHVFDIPHGQTTTVVASHSGTGFVLKTTGLLHTPQFDLLRLSASPGGWQQRPCDDIKFTLGDSGVAVVDSDSFETREAVATSADGTKVPYIVLMPKGVIPEHVIIDVYGSYSYRRVFDEYHTMTHDAMATSKTAIAFAIVRGDGNLGYDYAIASRTPYRNLAVADVVAVAEDVVKVLPGLTSKPAVRGQSAGGWLAFKSVLARPDLFSGAIGYSGAYLLKGDPLADNDLRYLGSRDDLAPDVAALKGTCPAGLHFRFLHAVDDFRTSYTKAEAFAAQLTAAHCPVEFVTFASGGHNIDLDVDQMDDAVRRLHAYFAPF